MSTASIIVEPERPAGADDGRFSAAVAAVAAAFGDPTRRDIFLHVRAVPGVTATEVATTFSLHPNVARHHLQRLVDGGYLRVETGRNAAGAGRPSKRYFCVEEELTLGLMQRRDDLLMRLLGEAMQRLGPEEAEEMAAHVGEEYGRSLASRMTPNEGQRTVRAAMHVVAETLTATASPRTPRTGARPRRSSPSNAPSATPAARTPCCARSTAAWSRACWPGCAARRPSGRCR